MIRRRDFITSLGAAAAWPVVARAQQATMPVIGYLGNQSADNSKSVTDPFLQGLKETGYVVRDANGQAIAYIYSRENEAEARQAKVLTKDEARRIAINIARLPELLGKGERAD